MRKNKAKILLIVLLVIAVAVIWIKANAEGTEGSTSFSPSAGTIAAGEEVTVTASVNLSGEGSIYMMAGNISYDSSLFEWVSGGNDNGSSVAVAPYGNSVSVVFKAKAGVSGTGSFSFVNDSDFQVATNQSPTVLIYDNFAQGSCSVTVEDGGQQAATPVLDPTSLTLYVGTPGSISVANSSEVTISEWNSDNPSVATVSNGAVQAVSAGTANITAVSTDGVQSNVVLVTVLEQPIEPDAPSLQSITLEEGKTGTINVLNDVSIASWESNDTNVATVDENGNVTAGTVGTAVITATSTDGKTGTATVTVTAHEVPPVEGEIPVINVAAISLRVNETAQFTITNGVPVSWSSNNAGVAVIDSESGVVVAVSEGIATVTATSKEYPDRRASATVYVTKEVEEGAPIITPSGLVRLKIGETAQMSSDTVGSIWSSNNTFVVQVDQNGLLTAISVGDAKVTVTNPSTNKSTEFYVAVSDGTEPDSSGDENSSSSPSSTAGSTTGNANTVAGKGKTNSTAEEDVPATGESTVEMIVVLGIVTLVVAAIILRKKSK